MSILSTQSCQIGARLSIAVLHPVLHFLNRAAHQIDIDPRFCANQFAKFHKLVRAELMIIPGKRTKIFIKGDRPLLAWTNAIPPMI